MPECTPALAPQQLQAVRVLLLGHEGRARRVGIRQADEAELGGRVDDQVLGPPANVLHQEAAPLQRLEDKVAVGHGAHGVPQQALEAQLLGHHLPVDAEGVACQRSTAEGASVNPLADLAQPLEVVGEGEAVAQHPVAPADGLGALQVGVAGHDVVDLGLCALRDDAQEALEEGLELVELVAQPQSHVGGDLLVAAAAGVQLPRDVLADDLAPAALVGGVDVLVGAGDDLEGAGLPLLLDLEQAGLDLLELFLGEAASFCVCAGEGDGAEDFLLVEDVVEGEGFVVLLYEGIEAAYWEERMVVSLSGLLEAQLCGRRMIEDEMVPQDAD